jgi:hypothetical protein
MRFTPLAIAAAALLTFSASASAQQAAPKLETGAWTGTVVPPNGEPASVTYDISYSGDTLKIKIKAGEHGEFDTYDVKFEGAKLTFKFRPGPEVERAEQAGDELLGQLHRGRWKRRVNGSLAAQEARRLKQEGRRECDGLLSLITDWPFAC